MPTICKMLSEPNAVPVRLVYQAVEKIESKYGDKPTYRWVVYEDDASPYVKDGIKILKILESAQANYHSTHYTACDKCRLVLDEANRVTELLVGKLVSNTTTVAERDNSSRVNMNVATGVAETVTEDVFTVCDVRTVTSPKTIYDYE